MTDGNPLVDAASGHTYVWLGFFPDNAENVTGWRFYNGHPDNRNWVTPLILRWESEDKWKITAIGAPRQNSGAGIQHYPFDVQAGTAKIDGEHYTFGWYDGKPGEMANAGVIEMAFTTSLPGFAENCPSPCENNTTPLYPSPEVGLVVRFNNTFAGPNQELSWYRGHGRLYSVDFDFTTAAVTRLQLSLWEKGAAGYLAGLVCLLGSLYLVWPAGLLWFRTAVSRTNPLRDVKLPLLGLPISTLTDVLNLWLLPLFSSSNRTLDAWVRTRRRTWMERGFDSEAAVSRRGAFISLPCHLQFGNSAEEVDRPGPNLFVGMWSRGYRWVEIVGVGGAGKTMLAVQIARWTVDAQPISRLPVLIDEDTNDLAAVVRRKLRAALREDVDDQLTDWLLASGRVLVIFDRLSERNEATFRYVQTLQGRYNVGAVLVTTRRPGTYEGGGVVRVAPLSLHSASLMYYMSSLLLAPLGGESPLDMSAQLDLATRLRAIIKGKDGELPLTPLVVKLYVDRALGLYRTHGNFDKLPKSIPEAYFEYLRAVNPEDPSVPNYLSSEDVMRAAQVIAVASLAGNNIPKEIDVEKLRAKLADAGWKPSGNVDPVARLKANGVLVERRVGARAFVRFTLDPVSEFLAADRLITDRLSTGTSAVDLIDEVKRANPAAEGFIFAVTVSLP